MPVLPRRNVDEIITLHELRPGLQEVYVEGPDDKGFFEWFLLESDLRQVAVFEIGSVNVAAEEVLSRKLADNNRGRVITLAWLLDERVAHPRQVVCVADADFDYLLEIEHRCQLLLVTDYTSVEMYAFNERAINKLLTVVVGFGKPAGQVLGEICEPLQFKFLVRVANHVLQLGCAVLDLSCACRFDSGVQLNEAGYLRHFLDACGKRREQAEVEACINSYRARLHPDPRRSINGHDFVSLLVRYIRSHPGCGSLNPATLARSVLGCVEVAHLVEEPALWELVARLRS
jgi:hypothetical protein